MRNLSHRLYFLLCLLIAGIAACSLPEKNPKKESVSLGVLNERAGNMLRETIDDTDRHYQQYEALQFIYNNTKLTLAWSDSGRWNRPADSFFQHLSDCRLLGLFPEDYHFSEISRMRLELKADSIRNTTRHDPAFWARADLLMTDAWLNLVHDVKLGRLPGDSVTLNKDSLLDNEAYLLAFMKSRNADSISAFIASLEPEEYGYHQLKSGIRDFLARARFDTIIKLPANSKYDAVFRQLLQKRLFQERLVDQDSMLIDSLSLSVAVKKYQEKEGMTVDGKAGAATIRMLNLDDRDRFFRIAISMDKYKKLPARMPENYIWVNACSNYLRVMEEGKEKLNSRVITGKPATRTPMLTSAISALITYPQWVPPPSIIQKEILPAVKKNPGYLQKKGFSLLNSKGEEVDPFSVDWSKYNKSIPYKVVQGSGDANALGIMKFFFENKYAVYLHDTNQRYLFGSPMRNLSHGCVRVQQWRDLLNYLLLKDSLQAGSSRKDSVNNWLKNKEKRQLSLRTKVPVFIRYLTCEGQNGRIIFYDDVYGDDKLLRERYFNRK